LYTAGYLVDLRGVQFDDNAETGSTWIHAMTVGTYHHPLHGEIKITPDRIQRFADSVKNNVREIQLDIDYDHKATGGEAAGWVQQAEARPDGLWLLVEWTKRAYGLIREKAYRYFSPEFVDEWEHPKTRVKFKDVLNGGAITNRPFLKDILPINMTEFVNASGGTSMDPAEVLKQLAKLFGLPEDTDPGVTLGYVQAKLGEKPEDQKDDQQKPPADHQQQQSGPPANDPPQKVAASENGKDKDDKQTVQLSEADLLQIPFVKSLFDQSVANTKALDEQAVNTTIVQLSEKAGSKNVLIPPVVKDGLKKQLSELPPAARPGLVKLFEDMIENGQIGVQAGENGHSGHTQSKTAADALDTAVSKKLSESGNKLTYADAVTQVAAENPTLYLNYQRELAEA
jgi:phage I-like protein